MEENECGGLQSRSYEGIGYSPGDKLRIAFNLLEYLKGLGTRNGMKVGTSHDWVECFADHEREELLEELLGSIEAASSSGDWSQIQEVIESWQETAEILSDKQLMTEIREAEEQIRTGETISWAEAKRKLNLR